MRTTIFCLCLAVAGFACGRALAAPPLLDPLDNPAEHVSTLAKLWDSGAITSACIVAAFLALVVLHRRVPWFAQGWRATWIAASIGGLGFLVDLINSGATPNASMLVIAATTTIATALKMTPQTNGGT